MNITGETSNTSSLTKKQTKQAKTFYRTKWGWVDQYFFIHNMEKALDAICMLTKITTTMCNPLVVAIPTKLGKHPFYYGILARTVLCSSVIAQLDGSFSH